MDDNGGFHGFVARQEISVITWSSPRGYLEGAPSAAK
jgi:hypothetical protein